MILLSSARAKTRFLNAYLTIQNAGRDFRILFRALANKKGPKLALRALSASYAIQAKLASANDQFTSLSK